MGCYSIEGLLAARCVTGHCTGTLCMMNMHRYLNVLGALMSCVCERECVLCARALCAGGHCVHVCRCIPTLLLKYVYTHCLGVYTQLCFASKISLQANGAVACLSLPLCHALALEALPTGRAVSRERLGVWDGPMAVWAPCVYPPAQAGHMT